MCSRIIIAISSFNSSLDRQRAARETWLRCLPENVTAFFLVGKTDHVQDDTVPVPIEDGYDKTAFRLQAFFRHALNAWSFDYLFKCDDDTYVRANRLFQLTGYEFVGSTDLAHLGYAQGGAGYLLSRRAVSVVADAAPPYRPSEDIWVSLVVQQAGLEFKPSPQLLMAHHDWPRPDNDIVTAHWCSPHLLHLIHEGFVAPGSTDVVRFFLAQHPHWWGPVKLLRNGIFLGKTSDIAGRWEFLDNAETLVLNWYNWPRSVLKRSPAGYQNECFRLDSVGPNGPTLLPQPIINAGDAYAYTANSFS